MSPELPGQEGGEQRLAAFLRAQWAPLHRYILRRIGDQHAAEDVRQKTAQAFVLRWRADGGIYDAQAAPLLYGIAQHKVADHFREVKRERTVPFTHAFTQTVPRGEPAAESEDRRGEVADAGGEDPFVAVLREVDLAAAGITLTHRQQQALELCYLDRFDQARAAQIMGVSVSGLQKHLDAARKRLEKARSVYGTPGTGKNTKEAR